MEYAFLPHMTLTLGRINCVTSWRNVCVWGKKLGLLFYASPLSVSLSFKYLSKAVFIYIARTPRFIPSPCFILSPESASIDLVRVLYPVRSPWSVFYTDRFYVKKDRALLITVLEDSNRSKGRLKPRTCSYMGTKKSVCLFIQWKTHSNFLALGKVHLIWQWGGWRYWNSKLEILAAPTR